MEVADSDTFMPDLTQISATEQLTVISNFTPLVLSTMSKYSEYSYDVSITSYNTKN